MNLKEFLDKFGNCEIKDVDKLKDLLIDKNKKWKPNERETYWFVSDLCHVSETINVCDISDYYRFNFLRIFKTQQECKRYLEIQLACQEASFEPDWGKDEHYKYFFSYNHNNNSIIIDSCLRIDSGCIFYFKSIAIAQSLIDRFGEKDIAKYVLGVG